MHSSHTIAEVLHGGKLTLEVGGDHGKDGSPGFLLGHAARDRVLEEGCLRSALAVELTKSADKCLLADVRAVHVALQLLRELAVKQRVTLNFRHRFILQHRDVQVRRCLGKLELN